jgi:hypothetical protein
MLISESQDMRSRGLVSLTRVPSITRIMKSRRRLAGECSTNGERRNAYRLLVGKPEGRRPLGRPKRRWMDNIGMDLVEVGCGDVDWLRIGTGGELV